MDFDEKRTCPILLDRIQDLDDHEAWSDFYQFYWELIIGWAKMNGCSDAMAQDVFQETIINLIRNLPDFEYDREKGYFRSYLKTIVIRRVRDAFRREGKYITEGAGDDSNQGNSLLSNLADYQTPENNSMDDHWIQTVLSQALHRSYTKVDYLTYQSFCLHVLEEMSVDEVAHKIGVERERNIYEHKNRMLGIIKREFKTIIEAMEGVEEDIDDAVLKKALEELVKGDPDRRITLAMQDRFVKMFEQITDLKGLLDELSLDEAGTYLIIKKEEPESINLTEEISLGRLDECNIQLGGEMVSGRHATIGKSGRGWFIRDEHSRNGVFVNKQKIINKQFLKNGDTIQIASSSPIIFIEIEASI